MRLGISSYTYGWAVAAKPPLSALALIDRAQQLGVTVLQLCDNLGPEAFTDASLEAIDTKASWARITLELGTRGTSPQHLKRMISAARRLQSSILRLVIDTPGDEPSLDEAHQRLMTIRDDLAEARVTLAIENHDRFSSAGLADFVHRLDSPLIGICLDTANSFGAGEGPKVVVETLGPLTVNLHLKDFAVQRLPHSQGFTIEGRPARAGMLDIPWLLQRLRDLGRDPNAIIELWTPPEPTSHATIEKESTWAAQSVVAMRQLIPN